MKSRAVYKPNSKNISHYELVDGEIVNVMSKYLNMTPIYMPNDGTQFGYQLKNGSFTGGLGQIESKAADLLANTRIMMDYNTSRSLFLRAVALGKYFFIIPSPDLKKEVLVSLVNSYDITLKVLFVACFIIMPMIMYLLLKADSYIRKTKAYGNFQKQCVVFVSITFSVSVKLPVNNVPRIFMAVILIYYFIGSSIFQGIIVKNLNANIVEGEIKNLDELLDKGYEFVFPEQLNALFKNADGSRMARKMKEIAQDNASSTTNITAMKFQKNVAIMMSEIQIQNFLYSHYDPITKKNLFTVVPECAFQFYLSFMVPKTSPFQHTFNRMVQRIVESGIIQYQRSMIFTENKKILIKRARTGNLPNEDDKVIRLGHLDSVFFMYLVLSGLCLAVFVGESIVFRVRSQI